MFVGEFASRTNNACKANVVNPSATLDFKFVCWGAAEQRNKKKNHLSGSLNGGRWEARTPDIFLVREALYQLS